MWPGGSRQRGLPVDIHIQQENDHIQVDVDMPGHRAQDIQVQVYSPPSHHPSQSFCVVEWTGQRRRTKNSEEPAPTTTRRLKLGPSIDCDRLAANLSRGVLRLTAPRLDQPEQTSAEAPAPRSIAIDRVD